MCTISSAASGPVAWWRFDEDTGRDVIDSVGGKSDVIFGNFKRLSGVNGGSVQFDGSTSGIVHKGFKSQQFRDGFTVEGWVAPQAYPWNWCAIVNQENDKKAGFLFGINHFGQIGLHLAVAGKWYECTSKQPIGFMDKWSHIAGTFDKDSGIVVYIDGDVAASLSLKGSMTVAEDIELQIARNHKKTLLADEALVRKGVNFPTSYSFDGIIDELKLYDRALSESEIRQSYEDNMPKGAPPLKWRKLPALGEDLGRFGAVYCKLKFYEQWDDLWRIADHPDVVVSFDDGPYKMVFWHGTNYNMNLVSENGIWIGDQSAESGAKAGCAEHMSDKQCRFAHVRVIENHDARVVVHWRYALCDVLYNIAGENEPPGWGAWADEYYYIYPDGGAVRAFFLHGAGKAGGSEPAILNNPGEKAEDNIRLDAVTVANMQGQIRTHKWDPWPADANSGRDFSDELDGAVVCVLNLKSRYKPFYVYQQRSKIGPYGWFPEVRLDYSRFPTWNHWPVSQAPSDGRYALAPDRVSSAAVTTPRFPQKQRDDGVVVGRFIMGVSDRPIAEHVELARSWNRPPEIKMSGNGFSSNGYSRDERAYLVSRNAGEVGPLEFELAANEDSPVYNPAFVVKNWGQAEVKLRINGKMIQRGKAFRYGYRRRLEGTDLIVWLRIESKVPIRMAIIPISD